MAEDLSFEEYKEMLEYKWFLGYNISQDELKKLKELEEEKKKQLNHLYLSKFINNKGKHFNK